ncbi:SymE family type I addiction module toxin [Budvicia diplopodorum]|uniref:SymE family type I addiction module toxin n=1 Tax=Budvicia diplopodorum TaxID=1119056 RepID=UPI00135950E6|nr:SymE family type I addiction module toxin [Budvicia diplopodorum]
MRENNFRGRSGSYYVSVHHENRRTHHPSLHLKSDWLEEVRFATNTPVTVAIEQGQLVIRAVTE